MVEQLYTIYLTLTLLIAGWLTGVLLRGELAVRRRTRERQLLRDSMRQLFVMLYADEQVTVPLPLWRAVGGRHLLAELVGELVATTYALSPRPLRRIVVASGADRALLRRVRRSRGLRRAAALRLLADLPHDPAVTREAASYLRDRCREVRFCALLVQLTAHPERALQLIGAFDEAFTAIETAEVMHLLRRGLLPIAYRPLLRSPHANLRRLGVEIVAQFGIEEADRELVQIATDSRHPALSMQALYLLAALHRPLRRAELATRIRTLSAAERRRLLRFLAGEAYTPTQIRALFGGEEVPYYERLTGSYKRSLVCV